MGRAGRIGRRNRSHINRLDFDRRLTLCATYMGHLVDLGPEAYHYRSSAHNLYRVPDRSLYDG